MRITKRQLRRIIRESLLNEAILYVRHGDYGYIGLEDNTGHSYALGKLVNDLLAAGDTDIFNGPQGVDEEQLQRLQASIDKGVQDGVERWDSDVFNTYYNVDVDRVLRLWSRGKNLSVEEVDELPSDIKQEPEAEYPEAAQAAREEKWEYEDDGTNEFEEYYS